MFLTERQAASEAGVDKRTIRRLILKGRLHAQDFGTGSRHHFRIDPADLKDLKPLDNDPSAGSAPTKRFPRRRKTSSPSTLAAFFPAV